MNMRSATMMNIYEHALKLTPLSRQLCPTGQIITLMSVDADKLFLTAHYFHALWHGPLATAIVLSFEIGAIPAICGIAVLLGMIPVQNNIAHYIKKYRTVMSSRTDIRVRLTNEVLQVIRAVKYYAWEGSMIERIEKARDFEVNGT